VAKLSWYRFACILLNQYGMVYKLSCALQCRELVGRTARAKCTQHRSYVLSFSIAQVFVFEFGENLFELMELYILPPTWAHRESTLARDESDV